MRNLPPLRMDLNLEIIPVEQITVGEEGYHFTFQKRKIPKTFFGISLWPLKVTPSKEDNRHQYV